MSTVSIQFESDQAATLWLQSPRDDANVVTPQLWQDLEVAVRSLTSSPPGRLIIASRNPGSFLIGNDADHLSEMSEVQLDQYIATGRKALQELQSLAMTTVAAINGDCLGAGLELALACQVRVAADNPSIEIGLTQAREGLIPLFGGIVRFFRTVGLEKAILPVTTGQSMAPQQALHLGLVDQLVSPQNLLSAAHTICPAASRKDNAADTRRIFQWAEQQIRERLSGQQLVAPLEILHILRNAITHGEAKAMIDEHRAILKLRRDRQHFLHHSS